MENQIQITKVSLDNMNSAVNHVEKCHGYETLLVEQEENGKVYYISAKHLETNELHKLKVWSFVSETPAMDIVEIIYTPNGKK